MRYLKGSLQVKIGQQWVDVDLWAPILHRIYESLHPEDSPLYKYAFGRRCGWCGVHLRWWQLNVCRKCKAHITDPFVTSPYPQKSRWNNQPDNWRRK